MTIAVLADDILKQELLLKNIPSTVQITWADSLRALTIIEADVYADLLFELNAERITRLKQLQPKPVLINAVTFTTKATGSEFIRINAWPTLLQRPVTEIAVAGAAQQQVAAEIFNQLQWKYQVVPDVPGMITPRVLATIINEAYFTLGAEVSTRQEIDIAMKLGTNYPAGPFEWSEKIGLHRVHELLKELSRTDSRYTPAKLLEEEASKLKNKNY